MMSLKRLTILVLVLSFILSGCGIGQAKDTQPAAGNNNMEPKTIKLGLMADFTALPIVVAKEKGLFEKEGINVEYIMFKSAVERNSALQAGELDGCNADIIAAMTNRAAGYDVKIAFDAEMKFSILSSDPSIKTLADLKGKDIGLSKGTIIDYVVDTIMAKEGLEGQYQATDIAKIPVRLQMLQEKKLTAACMPEPFASIALNSGASYITDSDKYNLHPDIFMFYTEKIEQNKDAYEKFFKAINAATEEINSNTDSYRQLLIDKISFPPDVAKTIEIPKYKKYELPREEDIKSVSDWLVKKGILKEHIKYEDIVYKGLVQ